MGVFPVQMTPDRTGMWIGSNRGTDRTRPARLDLTTGEETEVDSHPSFDLDTRAAVFPALPRHSFSTGVRGSCSASVICANGRSSARWIPTSRPSCGGWRHCPTVMSRTCRPTTAGAGW